MPEFYEPSVLKRLQETELSILKDFVAICEANGLEYYGIAGTGIGAIRHGGFIPWDDDIDIAMPRKDFEKMVSVVEREYKDRYYIVNAWRDKRYPLMTTRLAKRGTLFVENALKDARCPCGAKAGPGQGRKKKRDAAPAPHTARRGGALSKRRTGGGRQHPAYQPQAAGAEIFQL